MDRPDLHSPVLDTPALVVVCRGALKGRLRVRAKGQAHRYSCLIETALHRRAACLRTTGFSMEDV